MRPSLFWLLISFIVGSGISAFAQPTLNTADTYISGRMMRSLGSAEVTLNYSFNAAVVGTDISTIEWYFTTDPNSTPTFAGGAGTTSGPATKFATGTTASTKSVALPSTSIGRFVYCTIRPFDGSGQSPSTHKEIPWQEIGVGGSSGLVADIARYAVASPPSANAVCSAGTNSPFFDAGTSTVCSGNAISIDEVGASDIRFRGDQEVYLVMTWGDGSAAEEIKAELLNPRETSVYFQEWGKKNDALNGFAPITHVYDADDAPNPLLGADRQCTYSYTLTGLAIRNISTSALDATCNTNLANTAVVWDTEDNTRIGTFDVSHFDGIGAEPVGQPLILEICENETGNFRLNDDSDFNCTPNFETGVTSQNNQSRWVQWVYGTAGSTVSGVTVAGVTYTAAQFPIYGPIEFLPANVIDPNSITPQMSLPLGTTVGQTLRVRLRSWNICNAYDINEFDGGFNEDNNGGIDISVGTPLTGVVAATSRNADNNFREIIYNVNVIDQPAAPTVTKTSSYPTIVPTTFCTDQANGTYDLRFDGVAGTYTVYRDAALTDDLHSDNTAPYTFNPVTQGDGPDRLDITTPTAPAAPYTVTRYVTVTLANGCTSEATEITIRIHAPLNGGTISHPLGASGLHICTGTDPVVFNQTAATGGDGVNFNYQWQVSTTSAVAGFSDIAGQTAATFNPGAITQTSWFRRRVRSDDYNITGNCDEAFSNVFNFIVDTPVTGGSINGAQTICLTDNPAQMGNAGSATGGDGTFSYQWESSAVSVLGPFNTILGATSDAYDPGGAGALNQTTHFRRRVTSGACSTDGADAGTDPDNIAYSNTVTITVHQEVDPGAIGNPQILCSGDNPGVLTEVTPPGDGNGSSYTFLWEQSATGGGVGFAAAAGLNTNATYDPPVLTSTTFYRRRVTSGVCAAEYTNEIEITVNPLPTASNPTGGGAVCAGNPAPDIEWTLTGAAPHTGTWTDGTLVYNFSEAGTVLTGTSFTVTTPKTLNAGTYEILSLTDANGCDATAMGNTATITLGGFPPQFDSGPTLSVSDVCDDGGSTTNPVLQFRLDGNSVSLADFALRYTVDGSAIRTKTFDTDASGNPIGGDAPITFTDGELNSQGAHVITIVSILSDAGCQSIFNTNLNFTVNPRPASPTSNGDITVCSDVIGTATVSVNAPGGSTIDWYDAATGGALLASGISSFDPAAIDEPAAGASITYYAESRNTTTNCTSSSRTSVTLTSDSRPTNPTVGANQVTCSDAAVLSGSVPDNGGIGTWTVGGILYYETFSSADNSVGATGGTPTTAPASGNWTVDISNGVLIDGGDFFRVQGGEMVAQDTDNDIGGQYVDWVSEVINISGEASGVDISVDVSSTGAAGDDGIEFFYRLNGGGLISFNPALPVPIAPQTITETGIIGNSLQIVLRIELAGNAQFISLDNVVVKPTATTGSPVIADVNDPVSAVTNLQDGANVFTWTVTSALGACTVPPAVLTITKNPQPATADINFDLCETTFSTATTLNYDLTAHDAAVANGVAADRTVTWFLNAALTMVVADPTDVNISDNDVYYARVVNDLTTCTNVTPVLNAGSVTFNVNPLPATANLTPEFCENSLNSNEIDNADLTAFDEDVANGITANRTVTWWIDPGVPVNDPSDLVTQIVTPTDIDDVVDGERFYAVVENDLTGCLNVGSVEFVINPLPENNPIETPDGTTPATYTVCASSSTLLFQVDRDLNPGSTYTWSVPTAAGEFELFGGGGVNDFYVLLEFPNQVASPGLPITVFETSADGCIGAVNTMNIIVDAAPPAPVIAGDNNVCINEQNIAYNITAPVGSSTYTWTVPGTLGSIVSGQGSDAIIVNISTNSGNISVVETNATGCVSPPAVPLSVTVNNKPSMTSAASAALCSGETVSSALTLNADLVGTVFDWEVVAKVGAVVGASVGNIGTGAINQNLTNISSSMGQVIYEVTPKIDIDPGGGTEYCPGLPAQTVTIDVHPEPVGQNHAINTCSNVPLNYDIQADNIDLFGNSLPSLFTYTVTSTDNVNVPAEPARVAASNLPITHNYINTTTANVTVTYTITPQYDHVEGCVGDPFTLTVTVRPEPVGADDAVTVCGENPVGYDLVANIAAGNGLTTGTTFSWVAVDNPDVTGESITPQTGNTISDVITNITTGNEVVTYTVTPISNLGCSGTPFDVDVTVRPTPVGANSMATICSDVPLGINLTTSGASVAAATYTIATSANGLVQSAGTPSAGAGRSATELADDAWTNTGLNPVNVVYTVTPVSADGCPGASFTITVTVNPEPVGANSMIARCSDEAVNVSLSTNIASVAATTYNISTNANGLTQSAGTVSNGNGKAANELVDDVWTNTGLLPVNVVYTITPVSAALCEGNTFTVTVVVNPEPVGANATVEFCSDGVIGFNLTTNAASVAAATYDIIVNPNGLIQSSGTSSAGAGKLPNEIADDAWRNIGLVPVDVQYTITPISADGCRGNDFIITATINPEPVGINSSATVCSDEPVGVTLSTLGTAVPAATYNITVNPNGLTLSGGTPSAGAGKLANEIADDEWANTSLSSVNIVYTITPVSAAPESCAGDPFTITVTINPKPIGNNVTATRCSDVIVGITLSTSGLSVPATSYDIAVASVGLVQSGGTPSAGSARAAGEISDDVWRNTGLLPLDVTYTITPFSAAGCAGDPFTVVVTVDPEPVGTSSTETRCSDEVLAINITTSGTSVAADNYTIGVNANGLTLSGGTASGGLGKAANEIADDIWRNTGLNPVNVVYTITPVTVAGCLGDPFTITVTINPEPVGANSTATRCSDEVLGVNLTTNGASVAAATYTIAVNDGGLTLSAGTNSAGPGKAANELADDVWRNTGLNPVDVIYTITPVSADGCPGNDFTVTVTINPEPVGADLADTRCSDELVNFALTTSGTSVAAATYNISINANGLSFTGTTASGGNGKLANELLDDRWRNTGAVAVDVEYTIIPVSAAGCLGNPMNVVFTIDPEPVLLPTLDRTICSDEAYGVNLTTNGTSVSALTYNITAIVSNGLTASAGAPVLANGQPATVLADDAWTNTGTTSVDVEYTIVPVSADGCEGDPVVVTMTIDPEPVLSAGLDDVVCSDATTGLILATNGTSVGAANYNIIDRDVDPALATVFAASLANGVAAGYLANDIFRNTTAGPLTVTYEIVPVGAINSCEGDPVIVTITINPEPILSATLDATQCSDLPSGIMLNTQVGSVAAATYNITALNANGLTPSAGLPSMGTGLAANVIANDAWTNTTNAPVNVEYTVVPISADGCEGNAVVVTLTVSPEPVLSPLLSTTICSELPSGVILNTIASSVPAATYNITAINSNGLVASAGTPAIGSGQADNVIADDAWTNTSNVSVNVQYTIVPVSADGCQGAPVVVTLTIAPQPVLSATLDVTQCSDVASGILLNTNGISVAAASYNITFIDNNGLTASAGSPAVGNGLAANVLANDAWTNTTNAPVDVEYTIVPVSGSGCLGDPVVVTFTVNPEPVLSPSLSATQCSDVVSGITLNTVGTSVPAATYSIVGINSNGLTASAGSPALGSGFAANVIANDAWTNTGNAPVNVQYIVVPVSAAGCAGEPVAVVLTVNPEPVLSPTLNTTQCSDDPTGITLTTNGSSVTATTYNITTISNNGLTASAGSPVPGTGFPANEIADDAWTNTGTTNVNVQYTIVPVSAAGCLGNPVVVTVTVRPEPILSPGLDATVCSDLPSNIILGSQGGSVAATTFSITNIDAHGLTATAGSPAPGSSLATNAIADDVWRNTTNASVNVEYTVVPVSAAGCEGDPVIVTLTVDPEPVIVNGLDDNICSDLPVGLTLNTTPASIAALNYNIISRTVAGTLTPVAVAAVPANGVPANYLAADVFRNTGSMALTVVYVVEPVGMINGCRGDQKTITITIDPEPVVANLDKTVCSDDIVGLTLATNGVSVGALNYNIVNRAVDPALATASAAAVPVNGVGTNYLFNDRFTNTTNAPLTVVYTVEAVGTINGCVGDQKTITVTINPEPVVSAALDRNACSDGGIGLMLNTNGTSVTASGYNIVSSTVDPALTPVITAAIPANNVAANYLLGDIYRNTTAGALTVTYRVVPIGSINGCVGDFRDIVVTIDPEPVMAANLNDNVCSDEPTGLTLNTNGVSVGAASYNIVSRLVDPGLVDAGSAAVPQNAVADNYLTADLFRNTGSLPLTVVYRVVPVGTINGCTGDFIDITITIDPEPVVSPGLDKSVCSDAAIGLILNTNGASVTAPTYNIISRTPDGLLTPVNEATVPQAGVTSTYLSGDIFRNTTNTPLDVVYVVEGVGATNGCVGDQRTITITIQPEPVLQPAAPVVCSDLPIGLVLSTTGGSAPAASYNIVSRTIDGGLTAAAGNALVANGVSTTHLQNDRFTNTGSIDLFVTYKIEPVSADGCKGDQVDVIVTIQPEPVVDPTLNNTVCSREVSGIILDTNGSSIGAVTYEITAAIDPLLTGTATTGTGLADNAIENDVFVNTTTTPLKVIYTITPNGTNGCIGDARTVELTVRPEPVIDPVLDNTVCSNNANSVNIANIILGTNGTSVGANTYELVDVIVPGTITADGLNRVIGSTGGPNLIRNDKYTNTTNAPVVVVYEVRATSLDGCVGQSEFINLTINPEPIMVPGLANLCSGIPSGIIVGPDAGSAAITEYELKKIVKAAGLVADGGNVGLGIYPANLPGGQSDFLANDEFTNTTNAPQVVTYTIAPLAGTCRGADQIIQFTVNPAPEVASTLNRTVCTDDVAGIVLTTTPASAPAASYDITSITVDAGLVVTSADLTFPRNTADVNEISADQFSNPTDAPMTVTYDIVPISGAGCRGPVRSLVLTIEPTVKVVPAVVANSVCSNTPIDITLNSPTVPTSGTITYNYTVTASSGLVSGFLPIKNNLPNGHQITDNLVNNDDTPQTVTYRITPVAAGARNGNGCTGDFVDVVITIEPKPKLTVTPNTAAVCEGLPLSFTLTTTTVTSDLNSPQFRIVGTPVATNGVTGFSPDGTIFHNNNVLADVLSNPTTTAQTVTYTLLPEAPGVACNGDAVQLIVTVHPAPVVDPESLSEQICSGGNINIELDYDVTNTIGTWTAAADANIQGASAGAGSLLFQNLFNTSSTPGEVTYTITPQSPAGCFGAPVDIDVIVDPIPNVVATPTAQTICDDGTTNIALTSAVAGATFTWTVMPSSTNITGTSPGTGNSIAQAISNAGSFAGSVLYQVTPHGPAPTACAGMPQPVIVTVAPPVGGEFITNDVAICLGTSQLVTIMAAGQGPFSMVYNDGTSDITVNNVPGGYQFQAAPTATTTYTLVSVTDVNGCQAFPAGETLTITVGDTDASFSVVGPTNSCSPFTVQFQYEQVAGTTYTWTWGDGNLDSVYTATTNEPGKIVKHRYINTSPVGDLEVDVRLRTTIDPSQGGCFDTQTRKVSVNPTITPAVFPDKTTICSGEPVTFFNQTMGASSHRWFYRVQGNTGEELDIRTTINATFNFTNTSGTNPVIYEVVYRADNGNCPEEVIVPITVFRGADASFTEVVPEFIGGNATVTFTNTTTPIDGNDFSYEWDFGLDADPATYNGTDAVIEVDYSSPGLREITLTVTNLNAGTAGSACVNVERKTINILMPPLVAGFTVSPKAGCFPVELEVTSNTSTGDTFKWQVLDQAGRISATSTAPMPVFNLVNPGTYDVFLETTNTLTGQVAFAQVNGIEVFENPVASVQARPTPLFIPDTELITFNFSTGANMYYWDFGDGTTSEDFEPKHFYTLEGTYLLTLVAGNDYGDKDIDGDGITDGHVICYDTATQEIVARDGGLTKVPNAFTPNKGGPGSGSSGNGSFNDVFLPITRGVAQEDGAFIMQIFDRWGTLIFESRNQNTGWDGYDKNGNLVPAGVYVFKLDLRLADGQRTTQIGDVTVIR